MDLTKKSLRDYNNGDDYYQYVLDGCHYESTESLLSGMLNFCGCGLPEDAFKFIHAGLEYIDFRHNSSVTEPNWYENISTKEKDIFGTDGIAYFFYYWADKEEFTDHGGSVPGWLTDKGKLMLGYLKEYLAECENNE